MNSCKLIITNEENILKYYKNLNMFINKLLNREREREICNYYYNQICFNAQTYFEMNKDYEYI